MYYKIIQGFKQLVTVFSLKNSKTTIFTLSHICSTDKITWSVTKLCWVFQVFTEILVLRIPPWFLECCLYSPLQQTSKQSFIKLGMRAYLETKKEENSFHSFCLKIKIWRSYHKNKITNYVHFKICLIKCYWNKASKGPKKQC